MTLVLELSLVVATSILTRKLRRSKPDALEGKANVMMLLGPAVVAEEGSILKVLTLKELNRAVA